MHMLLEKLGEFKSSCDTALTSLEIFECVHNFVSESLQPLIPEEVEDSVETYCGAGFKKNDLLYHCSDCALDETCVMCENCFVFEAHKDHKYWYTICSESSGGSCDCGESDSWRNDLMCSKHKNCNVVRSDCGNLAFNPYLTENISDVLSFITGTVKEYSSAQRKATSVSNCSLILYNDERHSFGDVISILQEELQIDETLASEYANLVDQKGFAVVYSSSSLNVLERLSRKVSSTGLVTSIETDATCWNMILATEIMEFLVPLLNDHSWLRLTVVAWLLEEHESYELEIRGGYDLDVAVESTFQLMLLSDHRLWKSFRVLLNEILNLCNSISQETKQKFATIFCRNYKQVFEAYLKEKREPELSIVRFSVQLFTLIPVAEHCVKECAILASIFSKLVDIFEPACEQTGILSFASMRHIDYNKVNHLIHDALQIMRNLGESMEEYVMDLAFLEPFIYVLYMLTNMDSHVRKTGDHVEFERNNVDSAQYICFEIQKIAVELCRFAVKSEDIQLLWTLLDKYTVQSPIFQLYQREDKLLVPLYKSKRALSFFGSLAWFWGLLMQTACEMDTIYQIHPPLKLMKLFAKDSLTRLIFAAEVRSNLWVRNGSIMLLQEYFYSNTVFHHLNYVPDVFNCILLASFMELDPYINFLVDHSALFAYFEEADQNVAIVEQVLVVLISSITAKLPLMYADQVLINFLCLEEQTRTSLVRALPDSISELPDFRQRVLQYATVKIPSTLGSDAVIEIKPSARVKFDPFFWPIPMDWRMKTWVTMCEKKQFSLKSFVNAAAKERYSPSSGVTVAYKTLSGILSNLLRVDSSKFEFALVATLFCILMLSGDFFDAKEAAAIEKAVLDLKNNTVLTSSLSMLLDEFSELFSKSLCNQSKADASCELASSKPSIADKRAKIMQRFQAQRTNFLTESLGDAIDSTALESGYVCVVCSGTQKEDENEFVLPLQFNRSKIFAGMSGTLIRGCCHVFHRKCFEGLRGGVLRKCPLCSAAVDDCVSVVEEVEAFDASFLWSLVGTIDCASEDDLNVIKQALLKDVKSPRLNLDDLSQSYAYTVACLSAYPEDAASISPQVISTLEAVKKRLWTSNWTLSAIDTLGEPSIINDIMSLCTIALLHFSSALDSGHAARLIKLIATKYAANNLLFINQVIHFILFDRPLRDGDDLILTSSSGNAAKPVSLVSLISLPDRYDEMLKRFLKKKCSNCQSIPRSPAICLVCGTLVCLGDNCCRTEQGRECRTHRMSCSVDVGVFLLLKNCALILLSQHSGLIIAAPYLNEFGEHDLDLRSESPLYLNHHLYYKVLGSLWRNGEDDRSFMAFTLRIKKLWYGPCIVGMSSYCTIENFCKNLDLAQVRNLFSISMKDARWNQCYKLLDSNENVSRLLVTMNSAEEIKNIPTNTNILRFKKASANDDTVERVFVEEGKTLLVTNFFPEAKISDFQRLLQKYQLSSSLIFPPLSFNSTGKYLIVRFKNELDANMAYADFDNLLIRDEATGKFIKRLRAQLF